jgi:hypothetical protein
MAIMPRYQSSDIAVATPQGQFRDVSAPMDQLSAQMDRMTGFFIQEAKQQAVVQAEEYAADKAPTIQQIEEARRLNQPIAPIADKTTIFGRAANEAQSRILAKNVAAAADMQMAQLSADVESGKVRVNDIANQTNALIKGYSSALAEVDPMVARSLEADLAISGNRLFVAATKTAAANAFAVQQEQITNSVNASLPKTITQIYRAGPIKVTAGPGRETTEIGVPDQIRAAIDRELQKADALPAKKRKEMRKDILKLASDATENYIDAIKLSGSKEDNVSLLAQVRSGAFNQSLTDMGKLNTHANQLETRIESFNKADKDLITYKKKMLEQQIDDIFASIPHGNAKISSVPDENTIFALWADDPAKFDQMLKKRNTLLANIVLAENWDNLPEQDRQARIAAASANVNTEQGAKLYQNLVALQGSLEKRRDEDPGLFSQRNPEVAASYAALANAMATNQPDSIVQLRASNYAALSMQMQKDAGVAQDKISIMPKEYMDNLRLGFFESARTGSNWADILNQGERRWGQLWPTILREAKLPAAINALHSMTDRVGQRLLSEGLVPEVNKALKEAILPTEQTALRNAVFDVMTPFSRSINNPSIKNGAMIRDSISEAVTTLAMQYMVKEQLPAETAAEKAHQAVIGDAYEFGDGFRVPKNTRVPVGIVQSGANQIKETIALWSDEIQPPISLRNAETNLKPNEVKALYIDHLRNYGYWTNTPDDSIGLELKDGNGNPVYRTNNQKFVVRYNKFEGFTRNDTSYIGTRISRTQPKSVKPDLFGEE